MISQLLINVLHLTALYTLVGLGFALSYSATRFFNLTYAAIFVLGFYLCGFFRDTLGFPDFAAVAGSVVGCGLLGYILDLVLHRPLRRQNASPLISLLVSLGAYVCLQNAISLVFGDEAKTMTWELGKHGVVVFGASATMLQCVTVGVVFTLWSAAVLVLRGCRIGTALRATCCDPDLALAAGIDRERVLAWVGVVAASLIALAGISVGLDVNMKPTFGLPYLMMGIVAAIVGGIGRIDATILGALVLASAQQIAGVLISHEWKDLAAFAVLIICLLFRPGGIAGRAPQKAKV